MPGNMTFDELVAAYDAGEIDTVIAAQTDMQGRLMGKRFHAKHFIDSAHEETHACNYTLATDLEMSTVPGYRSASWEEGYGDYIMRPDISTLRRIPWLEGTALVLCDVWDHHGEAEVPIAPRTILKSQLARLEAVGLSAMMAAELEYFMFKESYEEAHAKGYRDLNLISAYNEDYHVFQTTKEEDVVRAVRNGLYGAGIQVECTKGEAWPGQGELNLRYADALTAADDHVVAKNGMKEIAWAKGRAITFMAKWDYDSVGSSCHVHQSLWSADGKEPKFLDPKGEYGMSKLMRAYMAGLLTHAKEYALFLAPNVNSYKRFQAGTFAPTKAVWSLDNRTAGYRVCGDGTKGVRVECRIGGADINPYLAFAAQIAAGIAGIEAGLELEAEFKGDVYAARRARQVPTTLREAMGAFKRSKMMRAAFGDFVVEHYHHAAQWEQDEYDRRVTDWEIARCFERT